VTVPVKTARNGLRFGWRLLALFQNWRQILSFRATKHCPYNRKNITSTGEWSDRDRPEQAVIDSFNWAGVEKDFRFTSSGLRNLKKLSVAVLS
jgi:hypothetical protein